MTLYLISVSTKWSKFQLRHALNELAVQAPAWLKRQVSPEWFDLYGKRTSNYLLPKKESERQAWAERVGADGIFLLEQIYLGGHHPELVEIPAVETLRQVWVQNFYEDNGQVRLRKQKEQPPSARRITSPYDLAWRLNCTLKCSKGLAYVNKRLSSRRRVRCAQVSKGRYRRLLVRLGPEGPAIEVWQKHTCNTWQRLRRSICYERLPGSTRCPVPLHPNLILPC